MSEQIFISYRREGGDVTAKLICEALKNCGYTVFYDYDSLQGGYFDERIYKAIEECNDFILILPPNSLDRCQNDDDWVRLEIRHALKHGKNIIPVLLPDFSFPENLPRDIANISRINGISFVMQYFDIAVIPEIIDRLISAKETSVRKTESSQDKKRARTIADTDSANNIQANEIKASEGLMFSLDRYTNEYSVSKGACTDAEIVIPGSHLENPVTRIEPEAFSCCNNLKSITILDGVTSIGRYAFSSCHALQSISIPESVTAIGDGAFKDCFSLKSITIPDGVTSIGDRAFWSCHALQSISIPESVTAIGDGAFLKCNSLKSITIPNNITAIKENTFHECRALTSFTIPDGVYSIENYAFMDCCSLKSITIPDSVYTICEGAFYKCTQLTKIIFKGTRVQWEAISQNVVFWRPPRITFKRRWGSFKSK